MISKNWFIKANQFFLDYSKIRDNNIKNSYFKEVDNRLKQLYDIIKSLNKDQKILLKISKQHFANVGYLSNADVNRDKCLNELLRNSDYFNKLGTYCVCF